MKCAEDEHEISSEERSTEWIKKQFSKVGLSFFGAIIISSIFVGIILAVFSELTETSGIIKIMNKLVLFSVCILIIRNVDIRRIEKHSIKIRQFFFCICLDVTITILGDKIGQGITSVMVSIFGNNIINNMYANNSIWIIMLSAVIITPIIEELLFRKILIDRLVVFGQGIAVLISALIFGFFHMNFAQLFYSFGGGLLYGYVYVKTGRVRYTIIMHMIANFIGGVIPTFINDNKMETQIANLYYYIYYIIGIVGIILFIILRKRIVLEPGEIVIKTKKRLSTIFLNPGMIMFFCLCIFNMILVYININ